MEQYDFESTDYLHGELFLGLDPSSDAAGKEFAFEIRIENHTGEEPVVVFVKLDYPGLELISLPSVSDIAMESFIRNLKPWGTITIRGMLRGSPAAQEGQEYRVTASIVSVSESTNLLGPSPAKEVTKVFRVT